MSNEHLPRFQLNRETDWADAASFADHLTRDLHDAGIQVRVFGSAAVALLLGCHNKLHGMARSTKDVDLLALDRKELRSAVTHLVARGFTTHERLYLNSEGRRAAAMHQEVPWAVDLTANPFDYAHTIDFADRFYEGDVGLRASELLLTKFQRPALRPVDEFDIRCIFKAVEDVPDPWDFEWMAAVLVRSWGFYYTVMKHIASLGSEPAVEHFGARLRAVLAKLPRPLAWRLRATVGPRMRYYQVVDHVS